MWMTAMCLLQNWQEPTGSCQFPDNLGIQVVIEIVN
jgi:hypothetical protein